MLIFKFVVAVIAVGLVVVRCEYYTALSGMENLIGIESVLATFLHKYIQEESEKLLHLKRFLDDLKNYHNTGYRSGEEFLSNPLNAILMLKRFRSDWLSIVEHMKNDSSNRKEFLARYKSYGDFSYLPTDDDFKGAIDALMRLKDTYNLKVSAVANGIFNDVQYNVRLSASDCLEIGKIFYGQEDFFNSVKWFQQAYLKTDSASWKTKVDVLDYLSFSLYKTNDLNGAIKLTKSLLELDRNHSRAENNLRIYLTLTKEKEWQLKNMKHDDGSWFLNDKSTQVSKTYNYKDRMSDFKEYKKLCRKESRLSEDVEKKLRCYYEHHGHPYLRIGPFKVEEAYTKPKIIIYHDVLYDSEIERLKELAKPKFQRATVQNAVTGQLEVAEYRISKSAWLKNNDDRLVDTISKRIHLMTGLNVETAEELQVVNYGIGGHYEPHFDFARKDEKRSFESLGTGNRIATVLFYMTDVEQGGATVFPYLKTALWPKKGSAAFWYNLYASGEGNVLTRHAACPVLVGSKWVANKWLHFVGQEFLMPCNRTLDDFELKGYTI